MAGFFCGVRTGASQLLRHDEGGEQEPADCGDGISFPDLSPEHRVFCSLLMTDYFDPETRERIEALLKPREVFSLRAQELILKNQKQGGLSEEDAAELVREGVTRIFKWTGRAKGLRALRGPVQGGVQDCGGHCMF